MSVAGSALSDAAHSFAAKPAGGKDAANQERSRKNPTGPVAALFLGRAELGATAAALQVTLKLCPLLGSLFNSHRCPSCLLALLCLTHSDTCRDLGEKWVIFCSAFSFSSLSPFERHRLLLSVLLVWELVYTAPNRSSR